MGPRTWEHGRSRRTAPTLARSPDGNVRRRAHEDGAELAWRRRMPDPPAHGDREASALGDGLVKACIRASDTAAAASWPKRTILDERIL